MKKILISLAMLCISLSVFACTWTSYTTKDKTETMTTRTCDWTIDDNPVILGMPRGINVTAYKGDNPVKYTSKYAYIGIKSFGEAIVEGFNEKGLQGSYLYLGEAEFPAKKDNLRNIDLMEYISYILSNFATVNEVINSEEINIICDTNIKKFLGLDVKPEWKDKGQYPLHIAISDATGDKAIIQSIKGEIRIYHGPEHRVMTNSPIYESQMDALKGQVKPSCTITSIDRFLRCHAFFNELDNRNCTGKSRTLLNMEALVCKVFSGMDDMDPSYNNSIYPTLWFNIIDLNDKAMYMKDYKSWDYEYYNFTCFDLNGKNPVELKTLKPKAKDYIVKPD